MRHELRIILKWLGNLLLLGAAFVLAGSLFYPRSVQVFNGVVCRDGGIIDNQRVPLAASDREGAALELACVGQTFAADATKDVGLLVLSFLIASGTAFYLHHRMSASRYLAPAQPGR